MTYKELVDQYRSEYKDLTSRVALTLETFLQTNGYRLCLTGDKDPYLVKTITFADNRQAILSLDIPTMLLIIQNAKLYEHK